MHLKKTFLYKQNDYICFLAFNSIQETQGQTGMAKNPFIYEELDSFLCPSKKRLEWMPCLVTYNNEIKNIGLKWACYN